MSPNVWFATVFVVIFVTQVSSLLTFREFKRKIETLESQMRLLKEQVMPNTKRQA